MFEPELTLELACARWWNEVAQFTTNADRQKENLRWLLTHFGGNTMLHDITPSRITHAIATRRGEPSRRSKYSLVPITNATVNRTMVQPLRGIIVRARDHWEVRVANIKWSKFLLREPRERVREATQAEEQAILDRLTDGYHDAVAFSFKTGARKMEVVGLKWSMVDWFAYDGDGAFTLFGKGKKERTLPMSPEVRELLKRQLGNHPDIVFTFASAYTRRNPKTGVKQVRGHRYPLTMEGYSSKVERAIAEAGVKNFRIHDTRHTAASRMAREVNLKVVQVALGHAQLVTTLRYTHVQTEDLATALRAAAKSKSAQESAQTVPGETVSG
jgi:integrase